MTPGLVHPGWWARLLAALFAKLPQARHHGAADHPVKRTALLWVACAGGALPICMLSMVSSAYLSLSADFNADLINFSCLSFGNLFLTGLVAPLVNHFHAAVGLRRALMISLAVVAFANAGAAFAESFSTLALLFTLSGLGGGLLLSLSPRILTIIEPPEMRPKKLAFWAIFIGIGSNFAPLAGGFLVEWMDWRGLNLAAPLIAVPSFITVYFWLPESKINAPAKADKAGILCAAASALPAVLFASFGQTWGWGSALSLWCLFGTGAGLLLLIVRSLTTDAPYMRIGVFRHPGVWLGVVLATLLNFGHVGTRIETILFGRYILDWTPGAIAALFAVPFIVYVLTVFPAGYLTAHHGPRRWSTSLAFLSIGASSLMLVRMDASVSPWLVTTILSLGHFGYALGSVAMTPTIMGGVPADERLASISTITAWRFALTATLMSLLTPMNVHLRAIYGEDLADTVNLWSLKAATIYDAFASAGFAHDAALGQITALINRQAMIFAFDAMFVLAGSAAMLGAALIWIQRRRRSP